VVARDAISGEQTATDSHGEWLRSGDVSPSVAQPRSGEARSTRRRTLRDCVWVPFSGGRNRPSGFCRFIISCHQDRSDHAFERRHCGNGTIHPDLDYRRSAGDEAIALFAK